MPQEDRILRAGPQKLHWLSSMDRLWCVLQPCSDYCQSWPSSDLTGRNYSLQTVFHPLAFERGHRFNTHETLSESLRSLWCQGHRMCNRRYPQRQSMDHQVWNLPVGGSAGSQVVCSMLTRAMSSLSKFDFHFHSVRGRTKALLLLCKRRQLSQLLLVLHRFDVCLVFTWSSQ